MSDDNKVVGLETAREAQTIREIEADQEAWSALKDQMCLLMVTAPLYHNAYYTAALHALLEALGTNGVEPEEAIRRSNST